MIKFYKSPISAEMQVYNGETGNKDWDDASYLTSLPFDWKPNNTADRIKAILQASASRFAFADSVVRASYTDAVKDDSKEVLIVLKGIHQFKDGTVGSPESAHITIAWFTYLYHFNVGRLGAGSTQIGVAALGVKSATEGKKQVSSDATGWTVVGKK